MQRLEEGSIEAFCVSERTVAEIAVGDSASVSIWVADTKDLGRAALILEEVQAQRTEIRCPCCGYDLRGHVGATPCPECGHSLTASAPDRECPYCHETVPNAFEICWNCGADVRAPSEPDA